MARRRNIPSRCGLRHRLLRVPQVAARHVTGSGRRHRGACSVEAQPAHDPNGIALCDDDAAWLRPLCRPALLRGLLQRVHRSWSCEFGREGCAWDRRDLTCFAISVASSKRVPSDFSAALAFSIARCMNRRPSTLELSFAIEKMALEDM